MKKPLSHILITVTVVFIAFTAGLFLGRNYNHSDVQVSVIGIAPTDAMPHPEETTIPSFFPVNINTATAEELMTLPGIGEVLAQRIIAYRDDNGPFQNVAALTNVEGIGTSKLTDILDYVTIGG